MLRSVKTHERKIDQKKKNTQQTSVTQIKHTGNRKYVVLEVDQFVWHGVAQKQSDYGKKKDKLKKKIFELTSMTGGRVWIQLILHWHEIQFASANEINLERN